MFLRLCVREPRMRIFCVFSKGGGGAGKLATISLSPRRTPLFMQSERMTRTELRAGASLSAIFGLRMLGLFFILPVFAVHAPNYAGGDNLLLVGIALGAYGL